MKKLSYANVVATIALVLALAGGTALAASKLVTSPKQIARGVVTNGKVKPETLQADRFAPGALADLEGAPGPAGEPGPQGVPGPIGPQGPAGAATAITRTRDVPVPGRGANFLNVPCTPGERAVGGGVGVFEGEDTFLSIIESRPLTTGAVPTGWRIGAYNLAPDEEIIEVRAYAICVAS